MTLRPCMPKAYRGDFYTIYTICSRWQRRMCKRKSRAFIHGRFHNIMLTFRFEYSNILVQCLDEKLQIVRLVESEESKYEAYNQTDSAGCCGGSLALFGFHAWLFGLWPYVNRFDVWPCSVLHAGAGGAGWRCLVSAWLAVLAARCLPCAWAGAFAWLAGVGAGAVHRLAAPACAGPVCSAAGQLSQQAHTAHAATAGPGSGEGLPIMPPRPGSAIAGRPAENGHGPPPRVFTAPGLVSW